MNSATLPTPLAIQGALKAQLNPPRNHSPRTHFIGGSEVGLCQRAVISSKRNLAQLDSAAMGRMLAGKYLEGAVVQLIRTAMTGALRDTGRAQREYIHSDLPFRAHPDGRILREGGDGILEVKTASQATFKRYQADGLPSHYLDQVQAQMGLSGLAWGLVVLVSRENLAEVATFQVRYDAAHFRRLEARARAIAQFLGNTDDLPEGEPERGFCFSCPYAEACPQLKAQHQAGKKGELPDLIRLQLECTLDELNSVDQALDPLSQRSAELREQIKTTLQIYQANRVVLEGGTVQMVASTRTSFDVKALLREAPELHSRFLRTATFSHLRVTSKGITSCLPTAS